MARAVREGFPSPSLLLFPLTLSAWLLASSLKTLGLFDCDTHGLQPKRSLARPIQLCHDYTLPLAQHDIAICDLQGNRYAQQKAAKVRIRVMAVAVGPDRIVVTVVFVFLDRTGQIGLNVVQERILPLIDKDCTRRMQRGNGH